MVKGLKTTFIQMKIVRDVDFVQKYVQLIIS